MVTRANRVLTRDQLLDVCYGNNSPAFDRSIDVCVGRLRRKLMDDPRNPAIIRTVRNGGYIISARVTRHLAKASAAGLTLRVYFTAIALFSPHHVRGRIAA